MNNYSRVYAEVNIDIIRNNISKIKSELKNSKFMAVIKADGYGHGAVSCAKYINDIVDFYGVATVDEALDLKSSFINKPILILGAIFDEKIPDALSSDIRFTVFDINTAKRLSEYAKVMNKNCYIHIKIDTGMNRIGFKNDECLIDKIKTIYNLPNIVIEGIFTHFANADEDDLLRANNQLSDFKKILDKLSDNKINIPIKHCANSAAILNFDNAHMDMVRAGLITYGYYPSNYVDKKIKVEPALSLKSHVIFVKYIEKNQGISYNSSFISDKRMKIATIPVGYGDGYPRSLSNIGYVLINGHKANIVGKICMDQFMVDVSDIEDVNINDEVILIGSDGKNNITLDELSNLSNKFNYEFICGLSKRIPRLYYRNGEVIDEINYFYTNRRI